VPNISLKSGRPLAPAARLGRRRSISTLGLKKTSVAPLRHTTRATRLEPHRTPNDKHNAAATLPTTMTSEDLEIHERFCGPPNSANGGYVCGRIARDLAGTVSVRLNAPPPLNTVLRREWIAAVAEAQYFIERGRRRPLRGRAVAGQLWR